MTPQPSKTGRLQVLSSVSEHLWNLTRTGYYAIDARHNTTRNVLLQRYYMLLITVLVLLHNAQEATFAFQVRADLDKLVSASFLLITHVDTLAKQFIFHLRSKRIRILFNMLDGPIFNQANVAHNNLLHDTILTARKVLRLFNNAALATCLLWAIFPFIDRYLGHEVTLTLWFPFSVECSPRFEVAVLYITVLNALQGLTNTTMDAVISTLLAQAKTQFTILRYDLEHVVAVAMNNTKFVDKEKPSEEEIHMFDSVLEKQFIKCMKHYQAVIEFSTEIQDIFGGVLLLQFGFSTWIICMTAYKMTYLNPLSIQFVSMILYMTCILTELFLFCYYGNELSVESGLLTEAIYKSDWLDTNTKFRRAVLIFTERTKHRIKPTAGKIIPLSMETFAKILKSSYTFYAVLNETK